MVNRNQGSGTRALIDRLLEGARPAGYAVQPRNHNAVAAAVSQGRADWGVTLDTIARNAGPRIPAGAGGTLRFRGAEIARESPGRGGVQEAAAASRIHARWRWRASG